jgi:hypothetical protein
MSYGLGRNPTETLPALAKSVYVLPIGSRIRRCLRDCIGSEACSCPVRIEMSSFSEPLCPSFPIDTTIPRRRIGFFMLCVSRSAKRGQRKLCVRHYDLFRDLSSFKSFSLTLRLSPTRRLPRGRDTVRLCSLVDNRRSLSSTIRK